MEENWNEEFDKVKKYVHNKRTINTLFGLWREAHFIEKGY